MLTKLKIKFLSYKLIHFLKESLLYFKPKIIKNHKKAIISLFIDLRLSLHFFCFDFFLFIVTSKYKFKKFVLL